MNAHAITVSIEWFWNEKEDGTGDSFLILIWGIVLDGVVSDFHVTRDGRPFPVPAEYHAEMKRDLVDEANRIQRRLDSLQADLAHLEKENSTQCDEIFDLHQTMAAQSNSSVLEEAI